MKRFSACVILFMMIAVMFSFDVGELKECEVEVTYKTIVYEGEKGRCLQ